MTGTMRNKPAKCCCDPGICLIQSNDLDSDADLDDNFTLSDGDYFSYHEAPFEAIQISNASETATANTPHPQSPYPPRVQIEFYGDNIGSQVRIILGGAIVVQVTVGDGTSDLDILDASDDSELTDTLACAGVDRNEWHRLTVCYDPDTTIVAAVLYDIDGDETHERCVYYPTGGAIGRYAAFGTGPSHVDNVYVRNFRFWRLWYCGTAPYTSDCHILGDDWDYYYELPERTYCYRCRCTNHCSYCKLLTEFPETAILEIGDFTSIACTTCPDWGGGLYLDQSSHLDPPGACGAWETFVKDCPESFAVDNIRITGQVWLAQGIGSVTWPNPYNPFIGTDPDHLYLFAAVAITTYPGGDQQWRDYHGWALDVTDLVVPKAITGGTISSSEIGNRAGTYNGQPYYAFVPDDVWWTAGTLYLHWDGTYWVIAQGLGETVGWYWRSSTITGTYYAESGGSWYADFTVTQGIFCDELESEYTLSYRGNFSAFLSFAWTYYDDTVFCAYDGSDATVRF